MTKLYEHASRAFGCLSAALLAVAVLAGGQSQVTADTGTPAASPFCPASCPSQSCLILGWCTYYSPTQCDCDPI